MLSKLCFPSIGIALGGIGLLLINFQPTYLALVLPALFLLSTLAILNLPINIRKIFLSIVLLDMVLLIDKHYFVDEEMLSSISGLHISITTISLFLLYGIWLSSMAFQKSYTIKFFPRHTIPPIMYILVLLLSIYNAKDTELSLFSVLFHLQMFFLYFYISNVIETRDDIMFIIRLLTIALLIQGIVIIIQYVTKTNFNLVGNISKGYEFDYFHQGQTINFFRPEGTGGDPTGTAGQIAMMILIVASIFFYKNHLSDQMLTLSALAIGSIALILTFSRGAWGSFSVGLAVFLLLALRYRWITVKKLMIMPIAIVMLVSILSVPIIMRLTHDDGGSAYSRIPLMKLAFNMIQEHPFVGVGINNFGIVLQNYISSDIRGEWAHLVHNQYLLVFAETGVFGIISFLLIVVILIHTSFNCIKCQDKLLAILSGGIVSSMVVLLLFMVIELTVTRAIVQLFWVMMATSAASERLIRMEKQKSQTPSTISTRHAGSVPRQSPTIA